jgi:U5 small nuclear ribonucleoprotein component
MDMLVEQTHDVSYEYRSNEKALRFTDTRLDEQQRGISLKAVPVSLVLEGSSGKSYVINALDTPGE